MLQSVTETIVMMVSATSLQYTMRSTQEIALQTALVFDPESVSYERSRRETAAKFCKRSTRVVFEIIPTQFCTHIMDVEVQ